METKSVFVALVGRPNVGKSSLLNHLIGEKVAIVTSKPQTTRTKITGILTKENLQFVFLDTPGIHRARTKLGDRMTRTVSQAVAEVDAAVMLFEPYGKLNEAELSCINDLRRKKVPAIAAVNKVDLMKRSTDFNLRAALLEEQAVFQQILPLSVREQRGCDDLLAQIAQFAISSPHYFPADSYTDLPEKVLVAEIVREKMLLHLYEEIPHGTAAVVERFHERAHGQLIDIDLNIYCEKKSHKGIIIGKGGSMLKKIATEARIECEELLGTKINLQCWVKIKDDWRDNEFLLNHLGFRK